jgi:hypothetical protein
MKEIKLMWRFGIILLLLGCKDEVKSNLVGKWQIERITFKTEISSADLVLAYGKFVTTINQDGTYTYNENGNEKIGHWTTKADQLVEFVHEDGSLDTFEITVQDGQLQMTALTIDLTRTDLTDAEISYFNLAKLGWISKNQNFSGSNHLQVIFIMKPAP